ncbi:hypothetical protein UFOVP785_35 [uncultured Caudovirales phage]|uniref:Uncharacterized protein n=1 Tax=uncultured Caudovirales phage TaxID=2100421 RepID=A0A6J5NTY8_9CAUD|nr:hypothetical protein UFOVP785_35 [uncultured Caudovirales phage]
MANSLKFSKEELKRKLKERARYVAGQVTASFFDSVSQNMPVENGHAHETLGMALMKVGELEGVMQVASEMLSRASGDPEAASRGYGMTKESSKGFSVTVGTSVGFVKKLNDGQTITPGDSSGSTGKKEPGTEGQLYGPRTDYGKGFLMWEDAGGRQYALSANWGPLGFFERAKEAADQTAHNLGAF